MDFFSCYCIIYYSYKCNFVLFQMMLYTCSYDCWFKSYMHICNLKSAPVMKLLIYLVDLDIILTILLLVALVDCFYVTILAPSPNYVYIKASIIMVKSVLVCGLFSII